MAKRNASKQASKSHKKGKGGAGKQSGGYQTFSAEQRSNRGELTSMSVKEQEKILKAEWQKLSPQQKQAYEGNTPAETSSKGVNKKKSPTHRGQSSSKKSKRGIKQPSHAKKTKKTGRRAGHPPEHCQSPEHHDLHEMTDE